jgi:hypothetical protein
VSGVERGVTNVGEGSFFFLNLKTAARS